jgi:hypothetical protein
MFRLQPALARSPGGCTIVGIESWRPSVQRLAVATDTSTWVMSMSRASRSSSLLRVIAWACLWPFAAFGGFALLVFGFGALAIGVRLLLAMFGHGGV